MSNTADSSLPHTGRMEVTTIMVTKITIANRGVRLCQVPDCYGSLWVVAVTGTLKICQAMNKSATQAESGLISQAVWLCGPASHPLLHPATFWIVQVFARPVKRVRLTAHS